MSDRSEKIDLELNFIFFEFKLPRNFDAQSNGTRIVSQFSTALNETTGQKWTTDKECRPLGKAGYYSSYVNENGSHAVLRYYSGSNLCTVDIQEVKPSSSSSPPSKSLFTTAVIDKLVELVNKRFDSIPLRSFLTLPRLSQVPRIFPTCDERIMVYDFDQVLCDVQSDYQRIKILHSNEFGNTLILDDYVNLAERDLVYTHQLMWKGNVSYVNKNVLVLGGGDGGVLNEVLKEQPDFITMVEIDGMVMNMCKKYLRGACGDSLDHLNGPRHKIIIDDCFTQLQQFADSGRQFDIVFSDLTDVPLVRENGGGSELREFWSLIRRALEMGLRVLKPGGLFLTHLAGRSSINVIAEYERMLNEWSKPKLKYERTEAMVPSFLEIWTFYRIWVEE